MSKQYQQRDIEKLGDFYDVHIDAMTTEKLHYKSAIAGELAYRDKRIAELERERDELYDLFTNENGDYLFEPFDQKNLFKWLEQNQIEQHVAGFKLGYWFARKTYVECMKRTHGGEWEADKVILNDRLEQLRKGAGDE